MRLLNLPGIRPWAGPPPPVPAHLEPIAVSGFTLAQTFGSHSTLRLKISSHHSGNHCVPHLPALLPSHSICSPQIPIAYSLISLFLLLQGFPGVIGCIDGTHIPIIAPSVNEGDYVNRKSFHSINVQIICDAANIITNVEAKWPGSVHDSRIFRECTLSTKFGHGEFTGYLLGDRGYPCLPYLLTPYPDPEPGPQQRYNLAHCRTRARVEMTIGMLKARFQCLQRLRVTPERACDIIVACVILHNIATIRGEHCPSEPNISSDPNHEHPDPPTDIQDGRAVRDTVCHNHFL
ncbi:putative nuclease HARBI1 [Pelmatolapia mariae]|uniref:putative nuclease HARBI1 n=1 Tax=Pelmatolapia mariae TaxID=158779 RepID=UPI002FE51EF0